MKLDQPVVSCNGVWLHAGERSLVEALELRIYIGERWAVLGPNGAGKSTLLHVLAGLRGADAGQVDLMSQPIAQRSIAALAEQRALVTDRWIDPFASTVLETVLTARYRFATHDAANAAHEQNAQHALTAMDCAELAPRDVRSLSRGERQRVALATALAQETPLLLLDEPTAHQDPKHQALVLNALAGLPQQTIVASLHDINAAAHFATHALLLAGDGRWQAGPVHEVMTPDNLSALFATRVLATSTDSGSIFYIANGVR